MMSDLTGMSLDGVLSLIEVIRAEMVPGGVREGMLAFYLVEGLEAYDAKENEYERYIRQEGACATDGLGSGQG